MKIIDFGYFIDTNLIKLFTELSEEVAVNEGGFVVRLFFYPTIPAFQVSIGEYKSDYPGEVSFEIPVTETIWKLENENIQSDVERLKCFQKIIIDTYKTWRLKHE